MVYSQNICSGHVICIFRVSSWVPAWKINLHKKSESGNIFFFGSCRALHEIKEIKKIFSPSCNFSCADGTLYPSRGQNQNHGFSFRFQFPFFRRLPRKKWFEFRQKVVLVFGFSFGLGEGVGVFCLLWIKAPQNLLRTKRTVSEHFLR